MTRPWPHRIGLYLRDALRGVRRAPVEMVATLATALTFSWALELEGEAFRAWSETAVACALLLVVAWTGTLLYALGAWSAGRRWTVTLVGALVIGIYAIVVADFEYAAEAWRGGLLVAAAAAWLVALPAYGGPPGGRSETLRRVDGRFALRAIAALLYGTALFAGLALALGAVDTLFELGIEGNIYGHVWGWIFFVLVPWIVIGGLHDYAAPATAGLGGAGATGAGGVAAVAQRIALFLVPPLLALYTGILYAYVVRILFTGEIPKNLVSPMVLAAGGLAALALLLFDPRPGAGPLARWLRLAPALFLPLAPLGAWALGVRIHQYGWTEFRVIRVAVLAALAVLAAGATVQLARRRPFPLHAAPLAAALVLLLGAVGPWSALAVSHRSQERRLLAALARVDVPPGDSAYADSGRPADSARVVPASAYEQIRGSGRYLLGHFGPGSLPPVLRPLVDGESRWVDFGAALGLRPDSGSVERFLATGGSLPVQAPVALAGRTAYRIRWPPRTRPREPGDRPAGAPAPDTVTLIREGRVVLAVGGERLFAELGPLMASLPPDDPGAYRDLPSDRVVVVLTDTAGTERGELLVWELRATSDSTGWRVRRLDGVALLPGPREPPGPPPGDSGAGDSGADPSRQ